jgi:hypothetical protein
MVEDSTHGPRRRAGVSPKGGHRSRYRLRKQTVEPVFGQINHARGFRQLLPVSDQESARSRSNGRCTDDGSMLRTFHGSIVSEFSTVERNGSCGQSSEKYACGSTPLALAVSTTE